MTNEETIRDLEILHYNDCLMPYEVEAIDTAISLLKQKPKTGRWIYHDGYIPCKHECSECGKRFGTDFNYCPNCGCKMQEVEE